MRLYHNTIGTVRGREFVCVDEKGAVVRLGDGRRSGAIIRELETKAGKGNVVLDTKRTRKVSQQLRDYHSGRLKRFTVGTRYLGGGPFFHKVWDEMRRIPYGTTISYKELARRAGNPRAVRAAGQACATNPIGIIVPCHRVVSSRDLGGFGPGLEQKIRLLVHEGMDEKELRRMVPTCSGP